MRANGWTHHNDVVYGRSRERWPCAGGREGNWRYGDSTADFVGTAFTNENILYRPEPNANPEGEITDESPRFCIAQH